MPINWRAAVPGAREPTLRWRRRAAAGGGGGRGGGVFGRGKFAGQPDADQLARGRAGRVQTDRPVLLLASSRAGEEALWLQRLNKTRVQTDRAPSAMKSQASAVQPAVQWLIVPRHPQRFDEVQQLLERAGLSVSRR